MRFLIYALYRTRLTSAENRPNFASYLTDTICFHCRKQHVVVQKMLWLLDLRICNKCAATQFVLAYCIQYQAH